MMWLTASGGILSRELISAALSSRDTATLSSILEQQGEQHVCSTIYWGVYREEREDDLDPMEHPQEVVVMKSLRNIKTDRKRANSDKCHESPQRSQQRQ